MNLDTFTLAYVECALWSTTDNARDDGGDPLDDNYTIADIDPCTLNRMVEDCRAFQVEHNERIAANLSEAGHSFWLNRNGHGSGFWDYPEIWGEEGADILDKAAHKYPEVNLYVHEGKIYSTQA